MLSQKMVKSDDIVATSSDLALFACLSEDIRGASRCFCESVGHTSVRCNRGKKSS
jgi:hypothetical protein